MYSALQTIFCPSTIVLQRLINVVNLYIVLHGLKFNPIQSQMYNIW